jgi:diphosphomevalonate decarboxylase
MGLLRDMKTATVRARSNIALVKYWGKAPGVYNVPAVGSISVTLDALWSETRIEFDGTLDADIFTLDGVVRSEQLGRITPCLDLLRSLAGETARARVASSNNFPTGAGLASSASGFAALVGAADVALGLALPARELSRIARQGSGSAARSIFGGFVQMHAGTAADGGDSFAEPLLPGDDWPLNVVVAVTSRREKAVGSGAGMILSSASSVYYPAWVKSHPADMAAARTAIATRDFEALADVSESSCLKMHAAAMAARPPLVYFSGTTIDGIELIRELRRSGVAVFFTVDAGPQIKAVCEPSAAAQVRAALAGLPGVLDVVVSELGPGLETL